MIHRLCVLAVCSVLVLGQAVAQDGDTLARVVERGVVKCGVNPGLIGFAKPNSLGEYSGFDVDFCRALASAVFNDPDAVEFVPVTAGIRFKALQDDQFDVLSRNSTWTSDRNIEFGNFVGVNYYDGQGFIAQKRSGIRSALELDNVAICVSRGTTTELNAVDFFRVTDLRYKPLYRDTQAETVQSYLAGDCLAYTTDRSALAALRTEFENPDAHIVLPEVISKEPLGPVVRNDDPRWENIARWTLNCMINAEELGVDSTNVAKQEGATPAVLRLIGLEGSTGEKLGLDNRWCGNIISQVGNYGEIYEKHIGPDTVIGLPRGVNALWTDGGLLYAPPIR